MRAAPRRSGRLGAGVLLGWLSLMGCVFASEAISPKIEWRLSTPLPDSRAGYAAGVLEGRLVIIGGCYWLGRPGAWTEKIYCSTVDAFDPATEKWERLPEAPAKLGYAASASVGNRLYVMGGLQDDRVSRRVFWLEKNREGFSWHEGPPLPEARVFAEAVAVDGKIFVVGGTAEFETMGETQLCCASTTASTTVWSWNPADPAATWKERARFPGHARWSHRLAAVGPYLYQFGGRFVTAQNSPVRYFNEVWRYDTRTDEWTQIAEMPAEIQLARAVFAEGVILLVGRDRKTMAYDPREGRFTEAEGLPEDALVDYFAWLPPFIVGAGGETRVERPRRRADWTFVGRITKPLSSQASPPQ
jgi:hypothetical protein